MSPEVRCLFPHVESLLRLLAVNPASPATAERSFSSLRRLKTYSRSTTGQSRLKHTALCHVHKHILDTVDLIPLMREFVACRDQRGTPFLDMWCDSD